jgi:ATP-dependent metalloprotease FtsH
MIELVAAVLVAAVALLGYRGVNIMPYLLLAVVGVIFVRRFELIEKLQGNSAASGKLKSTSVIGFESIGGQDSAKNELIEALDLLTASHENSLGVRPLGGILLDGPPGTGKTLLARATASYTDSVFLAAAGSEFIEMYAGVGAKRVRSLFANARKLARQQNKKSAVVFIDEMDVIGAKRGKVESHMEYDQTLNQLLVELDGIEDNKDVKLFVLGATNRSDLMDDALLRPGRFDRIVEIGLPDVEGRLAILKIHVKDKPLATDVDLPEIAQQCFGFSGAHLASLVNEAAIRAMRRGADCINAADFLESVDKVQLGEVKGNGLSVQDKLRVSYHECGHAMLSERAFPGSVSTVTVAPRAKTLGFIRQKDSAQPVLQTEEWLRQQIGVLLAGSVAEEIIYGNRSTGSANDYQRAIAISENIIAHGLSDLGIVNPERLEQAKFNATSQGIIQAVYGDVKDYLEENLDTLHRAAQLLAKEERITGDIFRTCLTR